MTKLLRTDSENSDFRSLVTELDRELAAINGNTNDFYKQFNKIDLIKNVVVAFHNGRAAGCGAIKEYDSTTVEIKRMYVSPVMRRRGIAGEVLNALETWAVELGYQRCVLETGLTMSSAVGLYTKSGYVSIPNYGQYENAAGSICFEKICSDR
jgi:GNAT superfamily N-acetyltransferase